MEMIERIEYALTLVESLSVFGEIDEAVKESACFYLKRVLRDLYDARNKILDEIEESEIGE